MKLRAANGSSQSKDALPQADLRGMGVLRLTTLRTTNFLAENLVPYSAGAEMCSCTISHFPSSF